jgi:hypothetical protein
VVMPGYRHAMGDGTYRYVVVAPPVNVTVQ